MCLPDPFKHPSFEGQAFLEAVQFFRQEKGHYGMSEMIIGNENQVLASGSVGIKSFMKNLPFFLKEFHSLWNDFFEKHVHLNHSQDKPISVLLRLKRKLLHFISFQILSNLVMEELLSSLQSMMLPKMKGKRNDRKRAWFGVSTTLYFLIGKFFLKTKTKNPIS